MENYLETEAHKRNKAAFENWLMKVHGLDSEWDEQRNCFKEYPAHLAWKAWLAAQTGWVNG